MNSPDLVTAVHLRVPREWRAEWLAADAKATLTPGDKRLQNSYWESCKDSGDNYPVAMLDPAPHSERDAKDKIQVLH